MSRPPTWSYGVTTVPERFDALLPRTLFSLAAAGFDCPRLFVDGADPKQTLALSDRTCLPVTARFPRVRTFANWALALGELYARDPAADYYAVFQDDFVTVRNLRAYLEKTLPGRDAKEYYNLYTFPSNQRVAPPGRPGFFRSNQNGRGAVALVFRNEAVVDLLTAPTFVRKPQAAGHRAYKSVDGGVLTALKAKGYAELVHNPSLTQHTGIVSSMGNMTHPLATSFPGEDFDALTL